MNGLFELKDSNDLFKKAQKDYVSFNNDPNDYDLFNLLTTLNHLREWICPKGYNSYKNKKESKFAPEEKIHFQLYQSENYLIIKKLCNNSKHFNDSGIGKTTEILKGFITGFNSCGDSIGQRNYLVEDKDLRDIIRKVFNIYKDYFA